MVKLTSTLVLYIHILCFMLFCQSYNSETNNCMSFNIEVSLLHRCMCALENTNPTFMTTPIAFTVSLLTEFSHVWEFSGFSLCQHLADFQNHCLCSRGHLDLRSTADSLYIPRFLCFLTLFLSLNQGWCRDKFIFGICFIGIFHGIESLTASLSSHSFIQEAFFLHIDIMGTA